MKKTQQDWISKAQQRLQQKANSIFADWKKTKSGIRWSNSKRRFGSKQSSPYSFGFSLPDYHHDLIAAVGVGDEETAKAIMLHWYI
tara:strand:- start:2446 stop:2703 length:258 start_codon:yes stop_codon:yes gene_type:complete